MKVTVELNATDIACAKGSIFTMIAALQNIATAKENYEPGPGFEPEGQKPGIKNAAEPQQAVQETGQHEALKPVVGAEQEAPGPVETQEAPEPTVMQETQGPVEAQEAPEPEKEDAAEPQQEEKPVDRKAVQNRLKELAREGKTKGIKAILTARGVRKFSELADKDLPAVLEEAEAL